MQHVIRQDLALGAVLHGVMVWECRPQLEDNLAFMLTHNVVQVLNTVDIQYASYTLYGSSARNCKVTQYHMLRNCWNQKPTTVTLGHSMYFYEVHFELTAFI